jgi:hypothetical protein
VTVRVTVSGRPARDDGYLRTTHGHLIGDRTSTPDLEADMRATDHSHPSQHTLVFTGDPDTIKGVGHLNDILHHHGLTSRLAEEFRPAGPSAVVVPVVGGHAGPALRALREAGEADWSAEQEYRDGTFIDASRGVGHGLDFTEIAAPPDIPAAGLSPLPPTLRRPVVALLDTGVQQHEFLPQEPGDPFLIDAGRDEDKWVPTLADGELQPHGDTTQSRAGHGTFIAGIVRQAAPYARVLSVRVMNDQGRAQESTVLAALHWILGYLGRENPVDVLCMAFGRRPGDRSDQPLVGQIERALDDLADQGVQLVASAGNDHVTEKIFPASYPRVTAVGAGFAGYYTQFTNYGDWVDRYRDGVDLRSILPGGGWARWSGTSFAAATFAADLAYPRAAR